MAPRSSACSLSSADSRLSCEGTASVPTRVPLVTRGCTRVPALTSSRLFSSLLFNLSRSFFLVPSAAVNLIGLGMSRDADLVMGAPIGLGHPLVWGTHSPSLPGTQIGRAGVRLLQLLPETLELLTVLPLLLPQPALLDLRLARPRLRQP